MAPWISQWWGHLPAQEVVVGGGAGEVTESWLAEWEVPGTRNHTSSL